ncbi:TCP-1/cpn60 chaperonin family protein [Actinopolymorpha sp. NPDC004070]|uniref:TCP-1/cpn60 chaperonin family protein n=1 Tax=Actinopolymorpha sp. NPDC004070 TaxID=3154548 RepID=UPI0033B6C6F0
MTAASATAGDRSATPADRSEAALMAGFDTLARLLALTLGPSRGVVLNDAGGGTAEGLDDAATIARRVTTLPGRGANAGAALLREAVRTVVGRHGDGGATTAVLTAAIVRHAHRMVAAGANPVLVREGITAAVGCAADALKGQASPVEGPDDLAGLVTAASGDRALAGAVGELLDVLGPDGAVVVEESVRTGVAHDYVDGSRWPARPAGPELLSGGGAFGGSHTELTLVDPAVVVADVVLDEPAQVVPILEAVRALPGRPPLLLVARDVTGGAATTCLLNDRRGLVVSAPVVLTTAGVRQGEDLADLALLTGATVLSPEFGPPPERFVPAYAGRARRAVVRAGHMSVAGGEGDRGALTDLAARLRTRAWELDDGSEASTRTADRMWLRQARLLGRVGAVRVGAATEAERDDRLRTARRAVRLARTALREGVVTGGGVAYLDCVDAVRTAWAHCTDPDRGAGMDAVAAALEAPFLRLVANAGARDPRVALAAVRALGPGHGIDVLTDRCLPMRAAGVFDVAGVAVAAVEAAGATAGVLVSASVVSGRG